MVPFLCGPMVLPLVFWWQVYLTFDAVMTVLPAALSLGAMLSWLIYRRALRLVAHGLHPYFSANRPMPRKDVVAMCMGLILVSWGWALVVLTLVVLPAKEVEKRSFTISEVKDCTRKCQGCLTQIELSNWVGAAHARLCADALGSRPRVGQRLFVRGKFSDLVQYVQEVERAPG